MSARSTRPFVEELPELVRARGLSLRKLAQRADVNPSHLSRVLRKVNYKTPSGELVRRVALALDLPYDYFPEYRESVVVQTINESDELRDELYDRLHQVGRPSSSTDG